MNNSIRDFIAKRTDRSVTEASELITTLRATERWVVPFLESVQEAYTFEGILDRERLGALLYRIGDAITEYSSELRFEEKELRDDVERPDIEDD